MLGALEIRLSRDTVSNDTRNTITLEFLNLLRYSNFPQYKFKVKVGALVILLRNLSPSIGLYNSTRIRVRTIRARSIECIILLGPFTSNVKLISRIPIDSPLGGRNPIKFKRD